MAPPQPSAETTNHQHRRHTILVAPVNAVGHVNACVHATQALVDRGHRVVCVVEQAWCGKLTPHGVEEYCYTVAQRKGKATALTLAEMQKRNKRIGPYSRERKMIGYIDLINSDYIHEEWCEYNAALRNAIQSLRPDLIISDENGLMPAIYYSGLPWIRLLSPNPLFFIRDPDLPPGGSGLPLDDRTGWIEFDKMRDGLFHSTQFNDYIQHKLGYDRYPDDKRTPETESLIIYAAPEEWNYPPLQQKDDHWFNLEVFNKPKLNEIGGGGGEDDKTSGKHPLEHVVPKEFLLDSSGSGKLIYFSMGSMGSFDVELMRRLVSVLGRTPHKYIVSKGPLHDQYDLAPNMWGGQFLLQTTILPHVDLVITHGGNNSVTETFALGKLMLVMPMFGDQFDNAQRLVDTGYGASVDPYNFTDQQLIDTIDRLLADVVLQSKLRLAAERIQATDRHLELALKIEQMLNKF